MDEVDQEIVTILQHDARNNTNAEISERVGLAQSTVGKRIEKLERTGIIKGYYPNFDYDEAGFPLRVLFICSSSITDRNQLIKRVHDFPGVISVKELMTGDGNIHVEVVGNDNDDITRLATAIEDLEIEITEKILVKNEFHQPASVFED